MSRFPTIASLASASSSDVQLHWSGLGYYRRARFLHAAASHIVTSHHSTIPSLPSTLLTIPGIGPYTAGAIASIAYGVPTPLVDGNVVRVLSRVRGVDAAGKGGGSGGAEKLYWALAKVLVEGETPGEWNQAVMELGATVCRPQVAECDRCPVQAWCRAHEEVRLKRRPFREGFIPRRRVEVEVEVEPSASADAADKRKAEATSPSSRKRPRPTPGDDCDLCRRDRTRPPLSICEYPPKVGKKPPRDEAVAVCVVRCRSPDGEQLLLAQRPAQGLLAGQWEFPSVVHPALSPPSIPSQRCRLIDALLAPLSLPSPTARCALGEVVHVFSHRRHLMHVETMTVEGEGVGMKKGLGSGDGGRWKWVELKEAESLGLTVGQRKVLKLAMEEQQRVGGDRGGRGQGKRERAKGKQRGEAEGRQGNHEQGRLEEGVEGEDEDEGEGEGEGVEGGQEEEKWEVWPSPSPVVSSRDEAIIIDD